MASTPRCAFAPGGRGTPIAVLSVASAPGPRPLSSRPRPPASDCRQGALHRAPRPRPDGGALYRDSDLTFNPSRDNMPNSVLEALASGAGGRSPTGGILVHRRARSHRAGARRRPCRRWLTAALRPYGRRRESALRPDDVRRYAQSAVKNFQPFASARRRLPKFARPAGRRSPCLDSITRLSPTSSSPSRNAPKHHDTVAIRQPIDPAGPGSASEKAAQRPKVFGRHRRLPRHYCELFCPHRFFDPKSDW